MNRAELVAAVAREAELSSAAAGKALDAAFGAIVAALKTGSDVRLADFGTFHVAERAAYEGRNPLTGEPIQIAASRKAKLKPAKRLRDELNGAAAE